MRQEFNFIDLFQVRAACHAVSNWPAGNAFWESITTRMPSRLLLPTTSTLKSGSTISRNSPGQTRVYSRWQTSACSRWRPSCQGFSTVGMGDPKDKRNSLFLQFVRIVKATKPEFLIVENVTGLLATKNESTLKAIFRKFEKLGYHLNVKVMSSDHYGVPEKKKANDYLR